MTFEVLMLDSAHVPNAQDAIVEQAVLSECGATVQLLHVDSWEEATARCERASALIVWHQVQLNAAFIHRLHQTRIIVRNGVGFDSIDCHAAAELGIPVSNVPDYGTEEVADHSMSLALSLCRNLRALDQDILEGNWRWQTGSASRRLRGQVFGIVGCGRIGTAVALRAKAFGFDVRFYDPYVPNGYEKAIGASRERSLRELLSIADIISLHAPLTEETKHLIDRDAFRTMRSSAFLVNTARGAIVSHSALEEALEKGWIAGAALDVLEHEPTGLDLIRRFQNCILTPHSAFYSQESMLEMRRSSAEIVRDALIHNTFHNVVNGVHPRQSVVVETSANRFADARQPQERHARM